MTNIPDSISIHDDDFSLKVCSELSADLANIVEEEHYILDNPITSPPTSFPAQLHRLDRLNLTAQTDIIQAKGALEEYFDTVLQMTCTMENNQRNIMERLDTQGETQSKTNDIIKANFDTIKSNFETNLRETDGALKNAMANLKTDINAGVKVVIEQ